MSYAGTQKFTKGIGSRKSKSRQAATPAPRHHSNPQTYPANSISVPTNTKGRKKYGGNGHGGGSRY